ncbi:peptidase S8 [Virgibacillus profundi]|uniref:Peptidase S8 n=1 Tax=Virgibacillus profundi TaxID=2024555 RepID=A0A2A2IIJ9_9BACI|nr:S8 family serine peptidase [Virgibacillus profundi]PAV31362.1 peptidase S8 [Virgibacillus profundi]PXY55548.1 peptidase S8 [Virgibacillus profundi]
MRFFRYILTAILILAISPSTTQANEEDLQSIIIEVEGDPQEHREYIETYHPFINVIATYEKLFNGLAIQGAPEKLAKMESLEFIKAIHSVQTYETTSPLITSPQAKLPNAVIPSELNTTDYTGEGVKVAVIDTGIDYNHVDLASNYVAGYDLVDLDDDPMETLPEQGPSTLHGTHVSGIIAANGELKGVAPDAEIYAYRALGPGGSGTSVQVIAAMEQAVEDDVDIMNLSLGNAVNGPDYPTSIAVNRAIELGVSVVIANGNNGPNKWTVGSPATASKALSVGASSPPARIPYLYETLMDKTIPLVPMIGSTNWDLEKSYPMVNAEKETNLHGKIALFIRNDIPFYEKAKKAEENGAIAVAIYNNEDGIFQGMIQNEKPVTIPVASIAKQDGEWLKEQLQSPTFQMETAYKKTESTIADFSSRGPVTVNWDIKPDVLAPGTNILSTVPGGYQELQGTSMAAPHVAGAIALIKEAQPDWTTEQIFGALKTTAERLKTEKGQPLEPIIQGMGKIQVDQAINTETLINDPLLSFGKIDDYKGSKTIEVVIENTTDQTQSYSFSIPSKKQGLTWKLPKTFQIKGNESITIPMELNIISSQINEGIHQGWLALHRDNEEFHLPYLFVNKTADNPKAMGFEFSLKPFSDDTLTYRLYVTDPATRVEVDLYDPDTLMFERNLLELNDIKVGMNEGEIKKSELGSPGHYNALITVYLENGQYESYETVLYIE